MIKYTLDYALHLHLVVESFLLWWIVHNIKRNITVLESQGVVDFSQDANAPSRVANNTRIAPT